MKILILGITTLLPSCALITNYDKGLSKQKVLTREELAQAWKEYYINHPEEKQQ